MAAVAEEVGTGLGIDGQVTSDIPVGAGLSSSASLELAVALALGFEGTPHELAQLGRRAEHKATGVPTGIMDQLSIAVGLAGHAALIDCHDLSVEQVPMPGDVEVVVTFIAHRTLEGSAYADRVAECAAAEAIIGPLRLAKGDAERPLRWHRSRHCGWSRYALPGNRSASRKRGDPGGRRSWSRCRAG